ncbi:MAG: hypothetical protein Q9M92_05230 [Enterobacterales bacterium]|nr:hypothetical protein [Enterobacterales bacterium]
MKKLSLFVLILCTPILAANGDFSKTEAKIKQAMQSDIRSAKELARDANRLPVQTLKFFGLRDNMKVIELIPGGGWYTKLLAPVLGDNGEFFVAMGTGRVSKTLVGKKGMEFMSIINDNSNIHRKKGAKFYSVDAFSLKETDVDIVFTFRNYHNFDQASRTLVNKAVFKALKSGGIYAVVDHTRRHMQADDNENRRRVDPVLAIKEIEQAGFEFVDYTNLHYRADDELRYEVGRKTVTGNTDRFTLKFRKP